MLDKRLAKAITDKLDTPARRATFIKAFKDVFGFPPDIASMLDAGGLISANGEQWSLTYSAFKQADQLVLHRANALGGMQELIIDSIEDFARAVYMEPSP
jgi:hypothetical protein